MKAAAAAAVMTWGKVYWPWFLVITSLGFLGAEIFALFTNYKNTLSDYARYELNVKTPTEAFSAHTASWLLTLGIWLVLAFWLTFHIWFERF